jgi:uncharacterized protein YegJ (DUF2314 family)
MDGFQNSYELISWFAEEDSAMLEAMRQAQLTYSDFVSAIEEESRRIIPILDEAVVKYAFPANKASVKVEHLFISDIELRCGALFGIVASEPLYTNLVKEGDTIELEPLRVSDWLYVINGIGVGGFTFKLMWQRFSEQEKSAYRNQPPFLWINVP